MSNYRFVFKTGEEAKQFVDHIKECINLYGQITLTDLEDLAGICTDFYTQFKHRKIVWRRSELCSVEMTTIGEGFEVEMPEPGITEEGKISIDFKNARTANNSKSPNPISVCINASCLTEDDFARIYREVMKVATEIDDRDILIQIV